MSEQVIVVRSGVQRMVLCGCEPGRMMAVGLFDIASIPDDKVAAMPACEAGVLRELVSWVLGVLMLGQCLRCGGPVRVEELVATPKEGASDAKKN